MGYWIIVPIALSAVSFIGSWAVVTILGLSYAISQSWFYGPRQVKTTTPGSIWEKRAVITAIRYGLAVSNRHVCPLSNWEYVNSCEGNMSELCCMDENVPTISTSGKNSPENCLFSATINAGAFLFLVFCVIHHAHILEKCSAQALLSRVALAFGCLAAIGAFLAGNCNPGVLKLLHYLGAAVSFLSLCFYCLLLTMLTQRALLTGLEHILYPARILITAIQILITICYCIFFVQESYFYKHLSAVFEWTLSVNLEFFELSFVFEFYYFSSCMLCALVSKRDEEKSLILS